MKGEGKGLSPVADRRPLVGDREAQRPSGEQRHLPLLPSLKDLHRRLRGGYRGSNKGGSPQASRK